MGEDVEPMQRRKFLRTTGIGIATGVSGVIAGCTGSGDSSGPPPRKSKVFDKIKARGNTITVVFEDNPEVESRADVNTNRNNDRTGSFLSDLSPVGSARAGKGGGGRGSGVGGFAAGSGGSHPTGRNGRSKWHGGVYGVWYNDHDDEVDEYQCKIRECGIGRIGPVSKKDENLPGAGPIPWDKSGTPGSNFTYQASQTGWYRVGADLVSKRGSTRFGWEAVDFQLKKAKKGGYMIKNQWKISPRL